MGNSPLVRYTKISPNKTSPRNHVIDTITIHVVVGQLSAESICGCFISPLRKASCNYGIGTDGRVSLCVDEEDRSWCSSNSANDNRAITIECASDMKEPYAINDKVYKSLIELCADICKRNNIKELKWEANKNLIGQVDKQNITVHRWFAKKSCPGDYVYERLGRIASEVNSKLNSKSSKILYKVQTGAFSNSKNANALLKKLKTLGFDTYMIKEGNIYKIQVGAYANKENAGKTASKLKALGFDTYIVTYKS